MRIRRRTTPTPDVLSASTLIKSPDDLIRTKRMNLISDVRAWGWYNTIGEVHFGLTAGAHECSRAVLKTIRWDDPETPIDADELSFLVDALRSPHGGQAQLISSFYLNKKVTGDCFFYGYPDPNDTEQMWFEMLSTSELWVDDIGPNAGKVKRQTSQFLTDQDIEIIDLANSEVTLSRIWTPHPRFTKDADSPLKALDQICDELDILTKSLKAKITSRLAMAGMLYISQAIQATNVPERPSGNPELSPDKLTDFIMRVMATAIQEPDKASAIIPIILRGPQGKIDELVKWIRVEAETFDVDIRQREELIKRILAGLDLRPEQVEGFSQSNHWSAWSTQDVHLKIDIAPEIEALCWAITKDFLWPQMREAMAAGDIPEMDETEIRRHWVWYSLDNLTVRPNKAESYVGLADWGAIRLEALRDATGATDAEAPSEEEYVRMLGWKNDIPYLATFGLNIAEKIEWDKVVKPQSSPGPGAESPTGPQPVGPGKPGGGDNPKPSDSNKPKSQQPQ